MYSIPSKYNCVIGVILLVVGEVLIWGVALISNISWGVLTHVTWPAAMPIYLNKRKFLNKTSNNQRLRRSAGNNDPRSKRFCSSVVLCVSFTWQMIKTRVIRLRVIEGPNARDQIAFSVFNTFLEELQTNVGYIHVTREACVITTWRLGLWAPLVARRKRSNSKGMACNTNMAAVFWNTNRSQYDAHDFMLNRSITQNQVGFLCSF